MVIGFDYWRCISHFPNQFREMHYAFLKGGHRVVVISAVGHKRAGTVAQAAKNALEIYDHEIFEVLFNKPSESPELKLAKCKELGVEMFFDDRQDVVDLLNQNGILAFLVPRQKKMSDVESDAGR